MKEPKDYKYFTERQKAEWAEYLKKQAEYFRWHEDHPDADWHEGPDRPVWDNRRNELVLFAAND